MRSYGSCSSKRNLRILIQATGLPVTVGQRPGFERVFQHGVVGQRQHPRSLQPLQAQQQRGKQNVGSRLEHRAVAAAIPVAALLLQRSVKQHDKKTNKKSRGQHIVKHIKKYITRQRPVISIWWTPQSEIALTGLRGSQARGLKVGASCAHTIRTKFARSARLILTTSD